jgi:hypothetical protein
MEFIGAGGRHWRRDYFGGHCWLNDVVIAVRVIRERPAPCLISFQLQMQLLHEAEDRVGGEQPEVGWEYPHDEDSRSRRRQRHHNRG